MKIKENVPIAEMTTMRIGGLARYVVEINSLEDFLEAEALAKEKNLSTFILGGGANTLGLDEGFPGIILQNKILGIEILEENEQEIVILGASGEDWDKIVEIVTAKGYTGIEALSMIPGTLGAAPVQNIGAYGQEVSTAIEDVKVFDRHEQKVKHFSREECGFSYRKSIFNSKENFGRYFILAVTLRLKKGKMKPPFYRSIERYIEEFDEKDFTPRGIRKIVKAIRAEKLPDPKVEASAGSFFKNVYLNDQEAEKAVLKGIPVFKDGKINKVSTGWLIEKSGLRGRRLFGFRVSEKAALVLINESAKSYKDLVAARTEIQETVFEKFGYKIEQEPVVIKEK